LLKTIKKEGDEKGANYFESPFFWKGKRLKFLYHFLDETIIDGDIYNKKTLKNASRNHGKNSLFFLKEWKRERVGNFALPHN